MDLIADILLISGALGVAFYCFVLSSRLTRFTDLEKGVGGAVAVLSAQVDDLQKALDRARSETMASGDELRDLTDRADSVSRKLELHIASLHDLPEPAPTPKPTPVAEPPLPPAAKAPEAPQAAARVPSFFASHRKPQEVA